MSSKHPRHQMNTPTDCSCPAEAIVYDKYWEGSAILTHGSRLRFGCLEFLFVIVDYEFISARNLSSQMSPRFTHFYDLKNKKQKKVRTSVNKAELRAIRKNEYPAVALSYNSSGSSNSKAGNKTFGSLKKLKKSGGVAKTNGSKKTATARKYKLDKIEAFLKLMNNTNKLTLLQNGNSS